MQEVVHNSTISKEDKYAELDKIVRNSGLDGSYRKILESMANNFKNTLKRMGKLVYRGEVGIKRSEERMKNREK